MNMVFVVSLIIGFLVALLILAAANTGSSKKKQIALVNSQLKQIFDEEEKKEWEERNSKSTPYNVFERATELEPFWGALRYDDTPFDIEEFPSDIRDRIYRQYGNIIIQIKDDFSVMALPVVEEEGKLKIKNFKKIIAEKVTLGTHEWNRFKESVKIFTTVEYGNIKKGSYVGFTANPEATSSDYTVKLDVPENSRGKLYLTWIEVCKKKTKDYIV